MMRTRSYSILQCITFIFVICISFQIVLTSPIVGGEPIPDSDEVFSFAVSMQREQRNITSGTVSYEHFCGGVLMQVHDCIAYVLSASHCFFHLNQSSIVAVFGAKNLQTYVGKRYSNLTIHSRPYNIFTYENDISLIKVNLGESCDNTFNPVRLIVDVNSTLSSPCYICGYGAESLYGQPTLDLRIAQVQITPMEMCEARLGEFNAPKQSQGLYCAHGANPNIDACGGDSGGGMLCMFNQTLAIVGIISYGLECGKAGMPGVYTEVTHHIDFIASVIKLGQP